MYIKNSDARERLLNSGRQEFLTYGYRQASLRRICQNAGVTTGAVYSCFANKEDLFGSIVGNTVDELTRLMQDSCEQECQDISAALDNDVQTMEFLWKHKEVIMILLDGSEGTIYEGTIVRLEEMIVNLFDAFYKQYVGRSMDTELLSIIVATRLRGVIEILRGGYALERSLELAKDMSVYANAGFQKLMKDAMNSND